MAYINTRLSTKVALGFRGGPEWATRIVPLDNGREQRNAQWLYPRMRYSAGYLNFTEEQRDEILDAFYAARGKLHAFRFKDHADWETSGKGTLAPEIGTTNPAQLIKRYTFGGQQTDRLIQAPIAAVVNRNGSPVAGTLDTTTGLFTPDAAWVAGTFTWVGTFDVWVRFDNDMNAFAAEEAPHAWSTEIELVEVRR